MGPEHHWFGLATCLDCTCLCFSEGVLGQFGGMTRFCFHTQLEHMVCMDVVVCKQWASVKEGGCLLWEVCRISSTEKLLDEKQIQCAIQGCSKTRLVALET